MTQANRTFARRSRCVRASPQRSPRRSASPPGRSCPPGCPAPSCALDAQPNAPIEPSEGAHQDERRGALPPPPRPAARCRRRRRRHRGAQEACSSVRNVRRVPPTSKLGGSRCPRPARQSERSTGVVAARWLRPSSAARRRRPRALGRSFWATRGTPWPPGRTVRHTRNRLLVLPRHRTRSLAGGGATIGRWVHEWIQRARDGDEKMISDGASALVRGGALGRTRTCNLLIRSQVLCPLSYERTAGLSPPTRTG